jgi:hypothetical protein
MPGGQREGGGPLPSIESGIQPLKTVKTAVVGQFGKRGILPAPDAVPREHETARYAGIDIKDLHQKTARYGSNGKWFTQDSPEDRTR